MKFLPVLTLPLTVTVLFHGRASAATVTVNPSWIVGTAIPDNNSSGLVDSRNVSVNIASIDLITVTLETSGGWNGDLYGYLQHSTGFTVLLNRPGRSLSAPAGSATSGLQVTLADSAGSEIHTGLPSSGAITGTWQADGRNADPAVVVDTTPRTTALSAFNGLDPNGTWTLFLADTATGDQATLVSWGLNITGEAVPEPAAPILTGMAALLAMSRRRRATSGSRS